MAVKILVITPVFWPEGTGGTYATYLHLKNIVQNNNNVEITVLTGTSKPKAIPRVKYIIDPLIKSIERNPVLMNIVEERYQKIVAQHDTVYIVYAYSFIPLAKRFKKKIIVHLHDYKALTPTSVILCNEFCIPFSELVKKHMLLKYKADISRGRRYAKSLLYSISEAIKVFLIQHLIEDVDYLLFVSARHKEIITKYMPSIASRSYVIYNPPPEILPIRKTEKETAASGYNVIYVGGSNVFKGFPIMVYTIVELLRAGVKVKAFLTGNYDHKSRLLLDKLNKCGYCHEEVFVLKGRIPYKELLELYSMSHMVFVPSIWEEPAPYTILEGLYTYTIPIAFKCGGIDEFLPDEFLVPEISARSYANKALEILNRFPYEWRNMLDLLEYSKTNYLKKYEETSNLLVELLLS